LYFQDRRPKEALKMFGEAARKQPSDATHALREAIAYEAERAEGEAIKAFERAIDLDPSLQRAYFELARLYGELGERSPRVRVLRRYVELFPESIKGRLELNEVVSDSTQR